MQSWACKSHYKHLTVSSEWLLLIPSGHPEGGVMGRDTRMTLSDKVRVGRASRAFSKADLFHVPQVEEIIES